jgi:hypothetical protein
MDLEQKISYKGKCPKLLRFNSQGKLYLAFSCDPSGSQSSWDVIIAELAPKRKLVFQKKIPKILIQKSVEKVDKSDLLLLQNVIVVRTDQDTFIGFNIKTQEMHKKVVKNLPRSEVVGGLIDSDTVVLQTETIDGDQKDRKMIFFVEFEGGRSVYSRLTRPTYVENPNKIENFRQKDEEDLMMVTYLPDLKAIYILYSITQRETYKVELISMLEEDVYVEAKNSVSSLQIQLNFSVFKNSSKSENQDLKFSEGNNFQKHTSISFNEQYGGLSNSKFLSDIPPIESNKIYNLEEIREYKGLVFSSTPYQQLPPSIKYQNRSGPITKILLEKNQKIQNFQQKGEKIFYWNSTDLVLASINNQGKKVKLLTRGNIEIRKNEILRLDNDSVVFIALGIDLSTRAEVLKVVVVGETAESAELELSGYRHRGLNLIDVKSGDNQSVYLSFGNDYDYYLFKVNMENSRLNFVRKIDIKEENWVKCRLWEYGYSEEGIHGVAEEQQSLVFSFFYLESSS